MDINKIKQLAEKFKEEELPDAESPYHHEAEVWTGVKFFLRWLEKTN